MKPREVHVVAAQTPPAGEDLRANLTSCDESLRGLDPRPDLVVFPELFARPFWCVGLSDPGFFDWAEDLEGPTVTAARDLARGLGAYVVTSFFERGNVPGEYYNSAAVVDRSGELVPGRLPSGRVVQTYRKSMVSMYRWDDQVNDEKFYFRPGPGFPVFPTDMGTMGVLICADRWHPEAWRVLALQGAEIVCVLNASQGDVADMFVPSMRTCAAQNLVYVVAANRAGVERVGDAETRFYGLSSILGPRGQILAQGGEANPGELVVAALDVARVAGDRQRQTMYRDRRPELYGLLVEGTSS